MNLNISNTAIVPLPLPLLPIHLPYVGSKDNVS